MHLSTPLLLATCTSLALPLAAQTPPRVQASGIALTNPEYDPTCITRTMVCYVASENAQSADLNGDGDANDSVAYVHDLRSGQSINLGHAVPHASIPAASDRFAIFAVSEPADGGQDWNGDGDTTDAVAFLFDRADGRLTSLGIAINSGETPAVSDRIIAFHASEIGQGSDLDGDGVVSTSCTYVIDPVTRVGRSLNPRARNADFDEPESVFALSGSRVYWSGGTQFDYWSYDIATDTATQLGLRGSHPLVTRGGLVAFIVAESFNAQDLNGDGDAVDGVLAVVPSGGSAPVILPLLGSGFDEFALDEHLLLCPRYEAAYATDWNGDGDTTDNVLFLYDDRTGVLTNTGRLAMASGSGLESGLLADVRDPLVAYPVNEVVLGADLNGDGDQIDFVLEVRDVSTGTVMNAGRAVSWNASNTIQISRGQVGFLVSETAQGGIDLDGSGVIGEFVAHVFDTRYPAAPPVNLGVGTTGSEVVSFHFDQGRAAVLTREISVDLNGDGDVHDLVLVVRGITPGSSVNTAVAVQSHEPTFNEFPSVRSRKGVVTMRARESLSGTVSLNGDADVNDEVLFVLRMNP